MRIDSASSTAAAYSPLTPDSSFESKTPQRGPRMCKSLYDPEPCCCPDWVIEELLDDTDIDVKKEPELKSLLSKDCVDCYTVNEWIEDKAAASHKSKQASSFPKSVFDAIMGFIKSEDSDIGQ